VKNTLITLCAAAFLFLSGCAGPPDAGPSDRIDVLVSILPQKQFVEAVGGEAVRVHVLIPPGASPATYEPKPGDLMRIEDADVYFRIGHIGFELAHASEIQALNPKMRVADTSADVTLRYFDAEESHGHTEPEEAAHPEGVDPHIWLSPTAVKLQVAVIAETLSEIEPEKSDLYAANAMSYSARLDGLHQELTEMLGGLTSRNILVFHPAWGYFADAYHLEQIAIEQEGKDPTVDQLRHIIDTARASGIRVIFVQEQFSRETARSIAQQIEGVVVPIDPLAEDYIRNLRSVGQTLLRYLNSKK
jgi:zinc transport system substrate-binding protein